MQRWRNSLFVLLLAAGLLGGCVSSVKREPVGITKEYGAQPLPISAAELEARTARLAKRLEQTRMGEKEKQVAMDLLNSYQMIGATLQPPMTEGDRQRIVRLLFETLVKMDEQYFTEDRLQENAAKAFEQYSSKRKEIIQDYLAGDYEKVVNKCLGLQSAFGEVSLPPDIGLLFSISLAKKGRLKEAVDEGERITRDLEKRPDIVNLRAYILEWQLAMGQEKIAQEVLKDLTQRVEENENVLKEAKKRFGIQPKDQPPQEATLTDTNLPPQSPQDTEQSVQAPEDAAAAMGGSLDESLAEVRELTKKREFTKAKFILLQQRIRFPEGPETAAIDEAMKAVELAQEQGSEAPPAIASVPAETEKLLIAKRLIEEENFDEALAKMDEIQKEGNAPPEMNQLREVATEKIINRERNRAAKLFLASRTETDTVKKEELLSSSLGVLKVLLEKYPSSPLKKKISENMAIIRDEMSRVKKKAE